MNVLDSKIIYTQYGIETYMDMVGKVEIKDIRYPSEAAPFYEITVGVEYFLMIVKRIILRSE
ncbi:hypothetical protein [Bacillus sp. ISL-47]|uniref:hypothetical protein n=1 Tax=Bacillus sp. ISL-47 TaxID=2819130 RepID=UPI001BECBC68|nr:hypothetical protein [Bacillus sp. ISL-47]MBT2707083.1 hypothetical protein [Pseudomonas sp. ISL-84]